MAIDVNVNKGGKVNKLEQELAAKFAHLKIPKPDGNTVHASVEEMSLDEFLGGITGGSRKKYEDDFATGIRRRGRWMTVTLQELGKARPGKPKGFAVSRNLTKGNTMDWFYDHQIPLLGEKVLEAVINKGADQFSFTFKNPIPVRVEIERGPRRDGKGDYITLKLVEQDEEGDLNEEVLNNDDDTEEETLDT